MSGRLVECSTIKQLQVIIAADDIAILRNGYWEISGSATVEAWGSATVTASGSATVTAYDSATVTASGSATVRAWDSATVRAWDSATVEAWGSATVTASGSATVTALGSATVTAIARAIVRVLSASVTVHASGWATIILHAAARVTAEASVAVVARIVRTIQDWAHAHGAEERDGKFVLLKWVDADGSTRGFHYPEGDTVEAPDWDPRTDIECGCGLHACASLIDAEEFRTDRPRLAVELLVDPADCRAPQDGDEYPHKVRFRRAFVSRVWDADKEGA